MPVGVALGAAAYHLTNTNRAKPGVQHKEMADWEEDEEIDMESKKLRARKLQALATKDLTTDNLRALFRLLDDDGSHEVSPAEIQRGLLLLGFENAADPVALSRLLVDIDDDKTGTITESEFMAFFSGETRTSLREKLDSYVIERAFITATFYGTTNGKPNLKTEIVQPSRLRDWLHSLPPHRGRLWLDVVGYDSDAHAVLAEALGMEPEDICSALLFQQPKLSVVRGALGPRANCILHTMSISVSPLTEKGDSWVARCCPSFIGRCLAAILGIDLGGDGLLDNKRLISKNQITQSPPAISLEQASVIVVDERTVVTLRSPAFQGEGDNSRFKVASTNHAEDPLATDDSVIREIYANIRQQMVENAPSVSHLFTSSVKGLSVVLMDMILQHNYNLRDRLQDWDEVLTEDIRKSPASLHTPHLEAIRSLTESFERALMPLVEALNPKQWDKRDTEGEEEYLKELEEQGGGEGAEGEGGSNADPNSTAGGSSSGGGGGFGANFGGSSKEEGGATPTAAAIVVSKKKKTGVTPLESNASFRMSKRAIGPGGSGMDSAPVGANVTGFVGLRRFFKVHVGEFNELAQDLQSMVGDMEQKKEKIADNMRLLASMKADMMNRTLYALTLLTAVSVPITFLTGLWGQNFADMTELDPVTGDEAGLPMSGYRVFWTVLISTVGSVIIGMWRMGLFKALQ